MMICQTTSDEGMAITEEPQKTGLTKYVVHNVLPVAYPFQGLDGFYSVYADADIKTNVLPRLPTLYFFESYSWLNETPNHHTSDPQAGVRTFLLARCNCMFHNDLQC